MEDATSGRGDDEYGLSIGAVLAARQRYDDLRATRGVDSPEALEAYHVLQRAIEHRNEMRVRHDAAPDAGRWDT